MSILVIGSVFVDIKGRPFSTFIPEGRNAGYMEQVHGGVGRNVAENLALAGQDVTFVSLVNPSDAGVTEHLEKVGIHTAFVRKQEKGMGTWLAIFNENGDVAASISVRPDLHPMTDIVTESHKALFRDCSCVVLELDIEEETVKEVYRYARLYDKPVIALVSVMHIAAERRDYLKDTRCFLCNQQEAGMLLEEDLTSLTPTQVLSRLTERLPDLGPDAMVITLGARGAVYASREGEAGLCPALPVEVRDTTGAGDAFCSGVALRLQEGASLAEACRTGTEFSARVITSTANVLPR